MATVSNRQLAVITGASSGIGFELAKQCISNNYDVVICAEDEGINEAATRLRSDGVQVYPVQQDLSTLDGCNRFCDFVRDTHRPIDALLLNAGVGQGGAFLDTPLEAELKMISLNCIHTVACAKNLLPDMVQNGQGKVLITGSVVSTAPAPYEAVYGATKAFVMNFAEAIREELKDKNITVTVLQPGPTDTNFFHRADMLDTKAGAGKKDDPAKTAADGFKAMTAGKAAVHGGSLKSKVQAAMNEVLPEPLKAKQLAKEGKPGGASKHRKH
jgi:short-subunit dehydrogenase